MVKLFESAKVGRGWCKGVSCIFPGPFFLPFQTQASAPKSLDHTHGFDATTFSSLFLTVDSYQIKLENRISKIEIDNNIQNDLVQFCGWNKGRGSQTALCNVTACAT